jgi:hypothetical protein
MDQCAVLLEQGDELGELVGAEAELEHHVDELLPSGDHVLALLLDERGAVTGADQLVEDVVVDGLGLHGLGAPLKQRRGVRVSAGK